MKRIVLFSAGRSDLNILKNLILKLENSNQFKLYLILGPAHFSKKFGNTFNDVKNLNIQNILKINLKLKKSNVENTIYYISNILNKTSKIFKNNKFDAALIMGDRYEMMSVSLVCKNFNVPIFHLCGGSITRGSIDDDYRYFISKMADTHFLETHKHKQNLIDMNIKKNLHVVGAPALENIQKNKKKNIFLKNLFNKIDKKKKLLIACLHPETTSSIFENKKKFILFMKILKKINFNIIYTYPNADTGYNEYINIINKNLKNRKNIILLKNLGIKNYYALLNFSDLMIGNSSSGIIESASFKIPNINIGERQLGRFSPKNVIHAQFNLRSINNKLRLATSKKFKKKLKYLKNPYQKKNTSNKIIKILKQTLKN